MEYLAFGLLGLGAIFILIGVTAGRHEKTASFKPDRLDMPPNFREKTFTEEIKKPIDSPETPSPTERPKFIEKLNQPPILSESGTVKKPSPMSASREYLPNEADQIRENQANHVKIINAQEPAIFFKEDAVLYVDKSINNTYEESQINSRLLNAGNIHRIGPGKISFDGFTFFFEDKKIKEAYKLDDIERISFYANCFIITKKKSGLTSIFFIDTTIRIKAIFETHRMVHAS